MTSIPHITSAWHKHLCYPCFRDHDCFSVASKTRYPTSNSIKPFNAMTNRPNFMSLLILELGGEWEEMRAGSSKILHDLTPSRQSDIFRK